MQKYLFALMALLMLSACSLRKPDYPPPAETIENFFMYIGNEEYTEAQNLLYSGMVLPFYEIEEEFRAAFKNISFDIISEEIYEDEASVLINISAIDFSAVMEDILQEAFYWIFEGITEAELTSRITDTLFERILSDTVPVTENYITITLRLDDGEWKIVADGLFTDAITGGMVSFAEYAGQWVTE